jgi:hypothetical protein
MGVTLLTLCYNGAEPRCRHLRINFAEFRAITIFQKRQVGPDSDTGFLAGNNPPLRFATVRVRFFEFRFEIVNMIDITVFYFNSIYDPHCKKNT